MQRWLFALAIALAVPIFPVFAQQEVAQVRVSPTPIPAIIPTLTEAPTQQAIINTPTITWTPTPEGDVQIEASTDTNVREEPDPSSQRVGIIKAGERYPVRGRYFKWLEISFSQAQSGVGWVFEDVVTIVGDAALIPNVDPYSEPTATPDAAQAALAQTLEFVTLTPGADLTLAAEQRILTIPAPGAVGTVTVEAGVLPTFTPPSEIIPLNSDGAGASVVNPPDTGVIEEALAQVTSGNVPPIIPIALLAAGGLLGLLVSSLRR